MGRRRRQPVRTAARRAQSRSSRHTFTRPNSGESPARGTDLELNATERLIESLTRRSIVLFRPPYFSDTELTTPDEVEPVVRAQRLGCLTEGLRVAPADWMLPGSGELVKHTIVGIIDMGLDRRR